MQLTATAAMATGGAAVIAVAWWLHHRQATPGQGAASNEHYDHHDHHHDNPLTRLQGKTATVAAVAAALQRDGAVVVEGLVDRATMATLSADVATLADTEYAGSADSFAGNRTYRCGPYLLKHSAVARSLAAHTLTVASAETVLKRFCRRIRLGAVACIRVLKGQPAQVLHRDDDEWPLQLLSDSPLKSNLEIEVTALWAVTDFTEANGATNVIPGSHGSHDPADATPNRHRCQYATMEAGSVLLFTGSVWHGAGTAVAETAGETRGRQGFLCQYICGWLHPEYNFHFALDPATSKAFKEPGLRALLGFEGPRLFKGEHGCSGPVYATAYTGYPGRTDEDFSAPRPPPEV
jgi:ectoine hydroxylase-related dioxygenase (phytanoyl-CoA dioxygenase family)